MTNQHEVDMARFIAVNQGKDLDDAGISVIDAIMLAELSTWLQVGIAAAVRHPDWAFMLHGLCVNTMPDKAVTALCGLADSLVENVQGGNA